MDPPTQLKHMLFERDTHLNQLMQNERKNKEIGKDTEGEYNEGESNNYK